MKILITGATSGFGKAMAEKFAAKGHDLIIIGRRADRLNALADELKNQFALKKNFIDTGLKHQVNFSDTTIVNTVGLITVDVGGHPYEFSRQRFFENKHFQNRVRDAFLSIFPTGFLVFFKGHEEGTFCIKIIPRN